MTQQLFADAVVPWRGMTREQYDALVATGLLEGAPVELLEGVLAEVVPQGPEHTDLITELVRWLVPRVPEQWRVRSQAPFAATSTSEPEPDLAVTRRTPGQHPSTAVLAVEVAVTSQRRDLSVKARIYAAAGVPQYWVVDVPAREVVVHTEPGPAGYAVVRRQPWSAPLVVPLDPPVPVDLEALLER